MVDAGGGTVDAVSYIVEQVTPSFRIRRITEPSGRRPCPLLAEQSCSD